MNLRGICGLVLLFILVATSAHAKLFRNAYISFDQPPNWDCKMEGTEWVCVNKYAKKAKEAIIILTAKEVGPTDSFAAYEAYLKTPKTIPDATGKPQTSKVLHVKRPNINNQQWIDGMHLGSEVSSYYTRYLATIKNRLAILVTFSAHKMHYTKYTNDFIRAVKSLKVVAANNILDKIPKNHIGQPNKNIFTGPSIVPHVPENPVEPFPEEPKKNKYMELMGLALLLAAVGIYLYKRKS